MKKYKELHFTLIHLRKVTRSIKAKRPIFAYQISHMKTSITIVRHGETEWNVAMRLQGNGDSALTENGLKQAKLAAKSLQSKKIDVLISSDQKRAYRTSEILNQFHSLPINTDNRFRERNFGIMEGLTRDEILAKFPDVHKGYMKRREKYQIPQGESLAQFYERVRGGLISIANIHKGKRILLVTHGGVLDCVMRMIFDIPLGGRRKFSIYNASINRYTVEEGRWQLEEWGNIDHLEEMHSMNESNS